CTPFLSLKMCRFSFPYTTLFRSGFARQSIKRVAPTLEQPIRLLVRAAQVALGQRLQPPLHIERPDRLAVLQFHDPAQRRVARDLSRRLDRVEQGQVVRQEAVLEQS